MFSILHHRGIQLILAYSWACTRPAILVGGKGRVGIFLGLLFLPFHSCSSVFLPTLFHLYYLLSLFGVVGWCEGAVYLTSLGRPMILAYSWARPAILVVGKGRGGMFLFLLFLHFHSCSSFFPVPLFHLLYSLFYLFSPFLWETTQNDPKGLTCRSTPTQSIKNLSLFSLSLGDNTKWPTRVDVWLNPNTIEKSFTKKIRQKIKNKHH